MAYDILQSSTQSALLFFLVQSSDHITALTGASPTVTISKNGAAFASPSGTVTEIANGWYKVAGNATDTGTLGPLALHATATSGDPCDILVANIVSYNPQSATNLGLSGIPTANPGAANGIFIAGANVATSIAGTAASGATPAVAALTLTGGAASTTSGGVASSGLLVTGGSGAASTNGAIDAATFVAGGTNTVASTASGIKTTGTSTGHGILATSGGGATGDGIQAVSAATNGNGLNTTGFGTGAGHLSTAGLTGNGFKAVGGGTSGDAILTSATSGHGATFAGTGTTKHGINATGGATSSDGIRATGGGTGNGLNAQSGSGATGDGIVAKSNATAGNGMTLTHNGSAVNDLNATTTPLTLAKTTNITGFNDITAAAAATGVWTDTTAGDFTTSLSVGKSLMNGVSLGTGLKIAECVLTDTCTTVTNQLTAAAIATGVWTDTTAGDFTTAASIGKSVMNGVALGTGLTINAYTGNTVQTGDSYARLGAPAGASVSADIAAVEVNALAAKNSTAGLTFTVSNKVDANTIDLAGQTVTAAAGVTFPTSVASPTNITAGTITTVTNLTNAATAGDFTSTMKTSIGTAVAASAVASVTGNVGGNVVGSVGSVTGAVGSVTGNVGGNVTGSVASVVAPVAITSNRKKGSTATFEFLMQNSSTGAPQTGLTVTMTISKDGGSSVNTSNAVTEIGLGQYQIVLTGTEMTANNIFLQATAASALTFNLAVQTQP